MSKSELQHKIQQYTITKSHKQYLGQRGKVPACLGLVERFHGSQKTQARLSSMMAGGYAIQSLWRHLLTWFWQKFFE